MFAHQPCLNSSPIPKNMDTRHRSRGYLPFLDLWYIQVMIGYFPVPYPDEILYSICARYTSIMNYPSKRSVVEELFGTRNAIAVVDLPSHLDYLTTAIPHSSPIAEDYLVRHHTLLPFYSAFLPSERVRRLEIDLHSNNGAGIHMRAGIMASRVKLPESLRYCPLCATEDRVNYAETYWHRIHQVPGVQVCPVHGMRIQESEARLRNRATRYEFVAAEHIVPNTIDAKAAVPSQDIILLEIAQDTEWLLSRHGALPDLEHIR